MPTQCPSCGGELAVTGLTCTDCDTGVSGQFHLPALVRLPAPDQAFISDFIHASGSLKAMAGKLGVSYPTVRNRLDDIIQRLQELESS